jgi:hypothetical protein
MLVKISAPAGREALDTVCRVFHARVSDLGAAGFIVEAAGRGEETDALIQALEPFGIMEVSRTGRIALQRGKTLDLTADLLPHGDEMTNALGTNAARGTMTGADMIPRVFAQEGVDTVFGYSGGAILAGHRRVFPVQRKTAGQ